MYIKHINKSEKSSKSNRFELSIYSMMIFKYRENYKLFIIM
jgi:hypothetical protein